jgi:hypothetical protein
MELANLPLYQDQENQEELRIFNDLGFQVPRLLPNFLVGTIPFGALVDFSGIQEMFEGQADGDDDGRRTMFQVYPQAGLLSCGHVVAQGLMYPFTKYLRKLNDLLVANDEDHQDYIEEEDWSPNERPPLIGIASQMYNSMMHNTRGNSSQQHGVVLGNVTAALAGYWARGTPHATKAANIAAKCDNQLPHHEYLEKIKDRPLSRDLRVENVIGVSLSAIRPSKRTGR